jgi:YgiT-type zinc finger domain-containing protein
MTQEKKPQLGKLPPKHTFFLNPYRDDRFTRCPICRQLTKVRKKPYLIHIDLRQILVLNVSGRYCSDCDLLILHQDVVEDLMVRAFQERDPSLIGNDYLIIGTIERRAWRESDPETLLANLHDFREVVTFQPVPGWAPAENDGE